MGNIRHGRSSVKAGRRDPTYQAWLAMKARCYSKRTGGFKDYGGRGIVVCERWRTSFTNFLADVGERPSPRHTLDRINTDGNYEPENVRWATPKEQQRNQRRTRTATINGVTKTLAEWSEQYGIRLQNIYHRLAKGMDPELAVTLPVNPLKVLAAQKARANMRKRTELAQ